MASLLRVIAVGQILSAGLALAALPEKKLDCSGVIIGSVLKNYGDVCRDLAEWRDEFAKMDTMARLDLVESCTCDLLRHKIVWESMLTHEIDTLFYSTRKLVESKKDETGIAQSLVMEADQAEHMYFWDRFSAILREAPPDTHGAELSKELLETFSNAYYNPDSYSMPYKKTPQSLNMRRLISGSCNSLLGQFGQFLKYLNNLRQMTENSRYIYRVVSYDESLYKIVSVIKMCQYMILSRELDPMQ